MCRTIFIVCFVFTAFSLRAQYPGFTPVTDLQKFKEQFTMSSQKIQTIKSDFVQEKNLSMLAEKIVSKGRFWFKKDNLVRMEYSHPFQYLMIINRDNVFVKDGQKENKISTKSNKLFQQINRITVDCVRGSVLSNADFRTRVFESKGSYLVELSPTARGLKDFFRTIKVVIDKKDYSVASIDMNELSGDNTLIRFTNKELNASIPDAQFAIK